MPIERKPSQLTLTLSDDNVSKHRVVMLFKTGLWRVL
jgi:hypothetical protein